MGDVEEPRAGAPVATPVDDEADHSGVQFLCKGAPQSPCVLKYNLQTRWGRTIHPHGISLVHLASRGLVLDDTGNALHLGDYVRGCASEQRAKTNSLGRVCLKMLLARVFHSPV